MVCTSTRVTKISETDFFKVFRDKTILIKDFCLLSIFYFYMFCILTIKIKTSYSRIFPLQINKKQTWYNNCTIIQTFCWSLKVLIFLLPGYYFQLTDLRVGLSVYYVIITFGFIPLMYLMQKIYIAQFSFRILTAKHLFWEVKINIKENK